MADETKKESEEVREEMCEEACKEEVMLDILKMVGLTATILFSYELIKSINNMEKG